MRIRHQVIRCRWLIEHPLNNKSGTCQQQVRAISRRKFIMRTEIKLVALAAAVAYDCAGLYREPDY